MVAWGKWKPEAGFLEGHKERGEQYTSKKKHFSNWISKNVRIPAFLFHINFVAACTLNPPQGHVGCCGSEQSFSKCGPWMSSISMGAGGLVRNANHQAPVQTYWIRKAGGGPGISFNSLSRWFWDTAEFENHLFRTKPVFASFLCYLKANWGLVFLQFPSIKRG